MLKSLEGTQRQRAEEYSRLNASFQQLLKDRDEPKYRHTSLLYCPPLGLTILWDPADVKNLFRTQLNYVADREEGGGVMLEGRGTSWPLMREHQWTAEALVARVLHDTSLGQLLRHFLGIQLAKVLCNKPSIMKKQLLQLPKHAALI